MWLVMSLRGFAMGLFFLLYVNRIPSDINFDTILFSDDTCSMMAYKNLKQLETWVIAKLERTNSWFRQNKLTFIVMQEASDATTATHSRVIRLRRELTDLPPSRSSIDPASVAV